MSDSLYLSSSTLVAHKPNGTPLSGDTGMLFRVPAAPEAERLIEFAGRVCYHSTARMGDAPDFVAARVREGHEDICEHAWASFLVTGAPEHLERYQIVNRYMRVLPLTTRLSLVSGNLRAWRDLIAQQWGRGALPALRTLAPQVFAAGLGDTGKTSVQIPAQPAFDPVDTMQGRVVPLAVNIPDWIVLRNAVETGISNQAADPILPALLEKVYRDHVALTVLVEGVSRACTHQFVRARTMSFSQESQRYVDLEKGGWELVVPPAIQADPAAEMRLREFWLDAQRAYRDLRNSGVRKEDARFLLPNATTTRLVVTGNVAAWRHFLSQRLDKAAQWEIRGVAEAIRQILERMPAPSIDPESTFLTAV